MELYLKKNQTINHSKLSSYYGTVTKYYTDNKLNIVHLGSVIQANNITIDDLKDIYNSKNQNKTPTKQN